MTSANEVAMDVIPLNGTIVTSFFPPPSTVVVVVVAASAEEATKEAANDAALRFACNYLTSANNIRFVVIIIRTLTEVTFDPLEYTAE